MEIRKYEFVSGARQAAGIAVIIDVFRAFSVACYCFDKGIDRLIPVGGLEEALAIEAENGSVVRIGERNGKKLPGFDFGNSPTEILSAQLAGKVVVQTTHAGTQGLVNALGATEVLTGALVNAKATADYIRRKQPQTVSLVRMGFEAAAATDEDDLCADYMESLLLGGDFAPNGIREKLLRSPCAERFLDPDIPWNPMSDFELCTQLDSFNFVLRLVRNDGAYPYLERVNVPL